MNSVSVKIVAVAVLLVSLLARGMVRRAGAWSGSQWTRFAFQLTLSVGLVALPIAMATEVDRGLTHGWAAAPRFLYVMTMIVMLLYGVVSGVQLLRAFAGDDVPPQLYHGYLVTFILVTLALGIAAWLGEASAIPFQRSGAVILGGYCLWLGVRPPEWVRSHALYALLSGVISETGTRVFYGAVGLLIIGVGIFGSGEGFFK